MQQILRRLKIQAGLLIQLNVQIANHLCPKWAVPNQTVRCVKIRQALTGLKGRK